MSSLLYGIDEEERIVGLAPHGKKHVRIWSRNADDSVTDRIERVHPFMFVTPRGEQAVIDEGWKNFVKSAQLSGDNPLSRLLVFDSLESFRGARKVFYDRGNMSRDFFTYGDAAAAYLTHSGKTMLKGLTPQTAHRLQFDIEAYRPDGFPDASRDPVIIISMCDNRGWEKVLYIDQTIGKIGPAPKHDVLRGEKPGVYEMCANEAEMLRAFIRLIHQRDPDILEGHNVFAFDLPYLMKRAALHGVNFAIGRDGTEPYTYETEKKFAERDIKYTNVLPAGRSIVDTMFLAIDWDVYTRALDGVGLKQVARTLGVSPPDREYIDGDQIAHVWDTNPDRVLKYALHDVYETRGISDQLISAQFALTQMLPLPLQKVHLGGKAGSIQSLFVREYLRQRASLPIPEEGGQTYGGYTDIFQTGVFQNVWYADVASLYPSIMLNYDIRPAADHLGLFQTILRELTDLRFATKRAMKTAETAGRKAELDARQSAFKIIINSFYGMLGAGGQALFATVSEADRVATTGQGLLRRMMDLIMERGGDIIECDTDGVLFLTPPDKDFETDGPAFCAEISSLMPTGIVVDFDGAFLTMYSRAKKNYALWNGSKIKTKGGSLKSRGLEPIFRDFIQDAIENILLGSPDDLRATYLDYQAQIMSCEDPARLAKTVTLKVSIADYENNVETGKNRAPQYEIAADLVRAKGRRVQKGDRISYVIVGTEKASKVVSYRDAQTLDMVKPGTHNKDFYVRRLYEIGVGRFGTILAPSDVHKVFPPKYQDPNQINLFGNQPIKTGVSYLNVRIKTPDPHAASTHSGLRTDD